MIPHALHWYHAEPILLAALRMWGYAMSFRGVRITMLAGVAASGVLADEVLYRYEGKVLPYDASAG